MELFIIIVAALILWRPIYAAIVGLVFLPLIVFTHIKYR